MIKWLAIATALRWNGTGAARRSRYTGAEHTYNNPYSRVTPANNIARCKIIVVDLE